MANQSLNQASKPLTLTVDDTDHDFLKQMHELNVKGNEKLKEIQQDPTLSRKDPAEQLDTNLANSEAAVEQYEKAIKTSQEALGAVAAANSAIRLKEREKTAFLVSEVQFDALLMGHDVEAGTEQLRMIFKAKPFLLKALDTEFASDIRRDVEEQLRRSHERIAKAWRRVADLEDPEFKAYNKRYEVSFQEELSKVNSAAREALQKLEGDVHALDLIRGDLRTSVQNAQAENARLFEKAASSEQLNEKVAAMQKQVKKLEEDLDNSNKAKIQLIKNHARNTNDLIESHDQLVSELETRTAERLTKQKERLEVEHGELKTSYTKTIAGLQAELEGEKRTVVSLRQQQGQQDAQMDLILQQGGQEVAKAASALSGMTELLQKARSRTYSDAHGPGNNPDDEEEARPPPARRPQFGAATRRSAIPIRSQIPSMVFGAGVGSAASYRLRSSVKLGGSSLPRPARPRIQQDDRSPEGQEKSLPPIDEVSPEVESSGSDEDDADEQQRETEVLSELNEVSRNLIGQMITPADWTTGDRRRIQACFLKLQANSDEVKQPRFGLDWCAINAATGHTTCWYQRVIRRKARWNGLDLFANYCPGCQKKDGCVDVCIDVKWADDDQAALPFDPASTQKRWIIQKRPKA